jgi:hypothetical protein
MKLMCAKWHVGKMAASVQSWNCLMYLDSPVVLPVLKQWLAWFSGFTETPEELAVFYFCHFSHAQWICWKMLGVAEFRAC